MPRWFIPMTIAAAGAVWLSGGPGLDRGIEAQRARLASEHAERMSDLDRLESRLLAAQAKQREWHELQGRHERVSAIACENASEHVAAMVRHDQRQEEKRRSTKRTKLSEAQAKAETKQVGAEGYPAYQTASVGEDG